MGGSLCNLMGVVLVPIALVDKFNLAVCTMESPNKVPRGQTHPILTLVASIHILAHRLLPGPQGARATLARAEQMQGVAGIDLAFCEGALDGLLGHIEEPLICHACNPRPHEDCVCSTLAGSWAHMVGGIWGIFPLCEEDYPGHGSCYGAKHWQGVQSYSIGTFVPLACGAPWPAKPLIF